MHDLLAAARGHMEDGFRLGIGGGGSAAFKLFLPLVMLSVDFGKPGHDIRSLLHDNDALWTCLHLAHAYEIASRTAGYPKPTNN